MGSGIRYILKPHLTCTHFNVNLQLIPKAPDALFSADVQTKISYEFLASRIHIFMVKKRE
jgi:hypothetical protein